MVTMSTIDDAALRKLAEAATQGPWESDADKSPDDVSIWGPSPEDRFIANIGASNFVPVGVAFDADAPNGRFIATANPSTVLALLDRNERQEQEIARLQDQLAMVREKINGVFNAIKHGDAAHQAWLEKTIVEYFAAIPASDCELLLEEARVLIEILYRSATPSDYWRIKIDDFFAKFPK